MGITVPNPHKQLINVTTNAGAVCTVIKPLLLTIEELRALGVALLHFFTFISSRLHVAVSHREHCSTRLHQELAHLHIIAGCSTVKRCPKRGWGGQSKRKDITNMKETASS